jgi:aryl carrier-like protein
VESEQQLGSHVGEEEEMMNKSNLLCLGLDSRNLYEST